MRENEEILRLDRVHLCHIIGCADGQRDPEGKCHNYGKIEPVKIDLRGFNPNKWHETTNNCMHPDGLMINAKEIRITCKDAPKPPPVWGPPAPGGITINSWSPAMGPTAGSVIRSGATAPRRVPLANKYITRRELVTLIKDIYPQSVLKGLTYSIDNHERGVWIGTVTCEFE